VKQGERSITQFFIDLKIVWEELEFLKLVPKCVCGKSCESKIRFITLFLCCTTSLKCPKIVSFCVNMPKLCGPAYGPTGQVICGAATVSIKQDMCGAVQSGPRYMGLIQTGPKRVELTHITIPTYENFVILICNKELGHGKNKSLVFYISIL